MLCEPLDYPPCDCRTHRPYPIVSLTTLLLDCWQREYDKRPYKHFKISRAFFEERTKRKFDQCDWTVLIEFLGTRHLDSIEISYIKLPKDKRMSRNLVWALLNAENIELKGVSLPVKFLEQFYNHISASKVRTLNLSENPLNYYHLPVLRCILIKSSTLTYLNVARCSIDENTFPILADGIHKSKSVKGLDISRPVTMTPVSIIESLKLVNTIAQLVWQNKLTELRLGQCNLNGHDMEPLSEYLASKDSKLVYLDLQANNIVSYGTEYLFEALAKSKTLQTLNLSSNNLGTKGGIVISRFLPFTNLRSLDISHNQIGSEAMYELLCAVKKPCELVTLKMYGNEFRPVAAAVVKRLIRAKVLEQENLDVTYTWDSSRDELCVIPYLLTGRMRT